MDTKLKEILYKHLEKNYESFKGDYFTIRSNKEITNHPGIFINEAFGMKTSDINLFHEWALHKSGNNEYMFIEYPNKSYRKYNINGDIIGQGNL